MDARVLQRAMCWTGSVLRTPLRLRVRWRASLCAAVLICSWQGGAPHAMAWQASTPDTGDSSQLVRLPAPTAAQELRSATPYDHLFSEQDPAFATPPTVAASYQPIVPWRTSAPAQEPPPPELNGALAARLRQGPTYDGAQSVIPPAETLPAPGGVPLPTIPDDAGEWIDPGPSGTRERPGHFARWFGPGIYAGGEMLSNVPFDYKNFYSLRSLAWLGGGVGIAAIIANTSADQNFQDWYDDKVKSQTSDRLTDDIRWMGRGHIMIPIFVTAGLVLTPFEERWPLAQGIGQWGRRTTRSLVVGGPMLLALQYAIGSSRPRRELNSYWHPFQTTNGVSGDAFIAGIVFISAAKQVENRLAKGVLYVAATVPAWGRVNDDGHYLSQAFLGVWLAAVTVSAVDRTDQTTTTFIVPYAEPGVVGGRVGWRW